MGLSLPKVGRKIWEVLTPQNEEAQRRSEASLNAGNQKIQQAQGFKYGPLTNPQARQQFLQQNQAPRFNAGRAAAQSAVETFTNPVQYRDAAVSTLRGLARVPETASRSWTELVSGQDMTSAAPTDPIRRALYGSEPIETYQRRGEGVERATGFPAPIVAAGLAAGDLFPGAKPKPKVTLRGAGKSKPTVKPKASRPYDKLQTQIEQAHNAGDKAAEAKLTAQLPDQGMNPNAVLTPERRAQLMKSMREPLPRVEGKQRGFVTSVKESPQVSKPTKEATQGTYTVRSTQGLKNQADQFAAGDLKAARADLDTRLNVPEGKITDREVADTISLAGRLDAEGSFEDASSLYSKLAAHLTKQGQSVQAASLLARRTPEGLSYHARKTLNKAGVKLDDAKQKKLQGLIENVRKTAPDTDERNRAVYDVTKYVNDQIPASVSDKIVNLWRAGLLTAPTTTFGNITGNLSEAITRKVGVNPVATAADAAMSLFTGKRTRTLAPLGSGVEGAKVGAKKLPAFLKTGYDERNALSKYDAKAISYGDSVPGKAATAYVNGVYRLMATADQPFYYSAHRNALGSIAKAEAINAKIPANQRAQWVDDFMNNPPKEALERAAEEAAYAVFQNKTGLGQAAQAFKKGLNKLAPGLGDFIVPFTQVPASIASRVVTRTPIGTAIEVVKQIRRVRGGGNFDQRAMSQAVGEGAVGVAILGAGYALANSGMLTFGYPKDEKERKLWESEGKQPYSVRIGDRWYSMNYMQPFGTMLAVGAKVGEQVDKGAGVLDAIGVAAGTAGQSIANQSFIKGVSSAIDTVTDPERAATKFLNQTGASIVPNIVRATARSFDPLQRESAGFVEGIKQGIPGLREQTAAKNDIFGEPLLAKDNPANQLLNPLRPSKARDTDVVLQEIRRLQDVDLGKIPSQINKTSLGKDVELGKEQIRELQQNVGKSVKQAWEGTIGTPEYADLDDEAKSKVLDRVSRDVLAVEKKKYSEANQVGEPKKLTAKQEAIAQGAFDPVAYMKTPQKTPQAIEKKPTATKKVSARRAGRPRAVSVAGNAFRYAVPLGTGRAISVPKVAAPRRAKVRSRARVAVGKPKVSLKKSRV